jgi:hypothetical protein
MRSAAFAHVALAGAAVAAGAGGCGSGGTGTECQCASAAVLVDIPASRAADVVGVTLSGRACPAVTAQCAQPAGSGCAQYSFEATGDGECDLDVQFSTAPADFTEALDFAQVTCCPGYYVQPAGASPIEVPDGLDAGAME